MLTKSDATILEAARHLLKQDAMERSSTRQGGLAYAADQALTNYLITLKVYDGDDEAAAAIGQPNAKPEPEPAPAP